MKKLSLAAALLVFVLVTSGPAGADIVSGSVTGGTALAAGGVFVKLTQPLTNPFGPPDSVGDDNFQAPTCTRLTKTRT
jgi:hypothetical protein